MVTKGLTSAALVQLEMGKGYRNKLSSLKFRGTLNETECVITRGTIHCQVRDTRIYATAAGGTKLPQRARSGIGFRVAIARCTGGTTVRSIIFHLVFHYNSKRDSTAKEEY